MSCFISVVEVRNAWIVSDTLWTDNDYALEELSKLIKINGGQKRPPMFIEYENYQVNDIEPQIKNLRINLKPYLISTNLYNISEKILRKIISDFIDETLNFGLLKIIPIQNIFRKSTFSKCLPIMRINRKKLDQEIYNKYLPFIISARKVYSNPMVLKNIEEIVHRIYIDPKHKFKHSLFDSQGKRLYQLYLKSYEWYDLYYSGNNIMLAVGAFGFNDYKAILFLAFDRIRNRLNDLEEKSDWRDIDYILPELLIKKLDLLHFFSWMKSKGLFQPSTLIQSAPLAKIIPGDGLHLFEESMDEDMQFELANFYPDIEYSLVS